MARGCLALLILSSFGPATLVVATFAVSSRLPQGSLVLFTAVLGLAVLSLVAYVVIGTWR